MWKQALLAVLFLVVAYFSWLYANGDPLPASLADWFPDLSIKWNEKFTKTQGSSDMQAATPELWHRQDDYLMLAGHGI